MTRKQEIKDLAEKMSKIRAQKIGMSAWYECVDNILTDQEKKEIKDLWLTMSGSTCWTDAFMKWYIKSR